MEQNNKSKEYDTIVIGSGAGGLSVALCLAREGHKVLVLEQHYVPGGLCHSFILNGQKFSPGIHYMGQMGLGESSRIMYDGLGVSGELTFFKMVEVGFEHCRIGDIRFDYPSNPNALEAALIQQFPHEKSGIEKYLSVVRKMQRQIKKLGSKRSAFAKFMVIVTSGALIRFGRKKLEKVIGKFIEDADLQAILNIQCGDHGLYPDSASFSYHCGVMEHYSNGGYYPMGGGAGLVRVMVDAFEHYNGELRLQSLVTKILTKKGVAYGVQLEDGEQILAKQIVSNADPHTTYTKLLAEDRLSSKLRKRLDNLTYSVSALMLFVTLEMDVNEIDMDSGNYWITEGNDLNKQMQYDNLDDVMHGEKFRSVFISSSTLKDPSSNDGMHINIEMITFIDNPIFDEWEHTEKFDTEKYQRFKEQVSGKFITNLEELIPKCRQHIAQMELGTPQTVKTYINTTQGSIYGIEKNYSQIGGGSFLPRAEIKNLFMCGSSTWSHGVAGATKSGIITAAEMLNCHPDDLMYENNDADMQIYEAEDPSSWPEWLTKKIAGRQKKAKEISPGEFLMHVDPVHKKRLVDLQKSKENDQTSSQA